MISESLSDAPGSAIASELGSYLPALQRRWIREARARAQAPAEEPFEAAVLLADLSGFTRLTEEHAEQGSLGAERMSELVNGYLGRTVDVVRAHGGDVLLFAGDSVLALWPAGNDLSLAACQAALCASTLVHKKPQAAAAGLRLHCAIGAGRLRLLQLGGVNGRWHTIFVGDAVRQLESVASRAKAGEVLLSAPAWERVAGRCRGEVTWSGEAKLIAVAQPPRLDVAPAPDGVPDELLRPHVPEIAMLLDRRVAAAAEFRTLAILFASLPAVDVEEVALLSRLQPAVETMQREIFRYEGELHQLRMDEKGLTVIAAFGLPPRAHEDDAVRAIEAASAMRQAFARESLRSSIGIASGRLLCGIFGNQARRQYMVLGSAINLASRLMQVATDDVVCDGPTAAAASSRLVLEPLPEIRVKGRSDPIRIFRPQGRRERRAAYSRPLLDRVEERRKLGNALRAWQSGQGGTVIVQGEAGIGKSHLLADLVERARLAGGAILAGEGEAITQSTRYSVWRAILARLLDPTAERPAEALGAELRSRLDRDERLRSWAPLLNEILPLGLAENEITSQMESTARADSTRDLVVHLLREHASLGPTLLVLDDAHWFDSSSLVLGRDVARRLPEILVVVGTRPPESGALPELHLLLDTQGAERLLLDSLPLDLVAELVRRRLGVDELPAAVSDFVWRRAEGHPLYTEELAAALRDAGLIVTEGGKCRATSSAGEFAAVSLPATLQGIITRRVDQLTRAEQLTIKVASVIGRTFSVRMLEEVHPDPVERSELVAQLGRLEQSDLIRLERADPEPVFAFKHAITRDVVYEGMHSAQRAPHHRRVAEWVERDSADDLTGNAPLLAHHWELAGEPAKAVDYLEQAGTRAVRSFTNREAISFLARASALADRHGLEVDSGRRSVWEHGLGEAQRNLSNYQVARSHLRRALVLRKIRAPASSATLVLDLLRQAARQILHRYVPALLEGASEAERDRRRLEAAVFMRLAEVAYFHGEALPLVHAAFRSLNAGEISRSTTETISGSGALTVVLGLFGLHGLARRYAERTIALADRDGNLYDKAYAREIITTYRISIGDWSFVDEACSAGGEIFARLGDRHRWEISRSLHGFSFVARGQFESADRAFEEAYLSAHPDGAVQVRVWARAGQLASRLPRGEKHIRFLPELEDLARAGLNPTEAVLAEGLLALARLRRSEEALALERADAALAILTASMPAVYYVHWSAGAVAEVYLSLWEAGDSSLRKRARSACRVLRRIAFMNPIARPRADWIDGLLAWLEGKRGRARRLWQRSRVGAERLAMPHETALACCEIGRHLPRTDPARAEMLEQASRIFTEIGATVDADRTRKLRDGGSSRAT
jgi:class 3 adenylate cyclase/tetratricopeptide (TPR) repeat protein